MLNPGEHRVIFGGDAVNWQRDHGRTIAGLSLSNAGDAVRLWHAVGPDTMLVESYGLVERTNRVGGRDVKQYQFKKDLGGSGDSDTAPSPPKIRLER